MYLYPACLGLWPVSLAEALEESLLFGGRTVPTSQVQKHVHCQHKTRKVQYSELPLRVYIHLPRVTVVSVDEKTTYSRCPPTLIKAPCPLRGHSIYLPILLWNNPPVESSCRSTSFGTASYGTTFHWTTSHRTTSHRATSHRISSLGRAFYSSILWDNLLWDTLFQDTLLSSYRITSYGITYYMTLSCRIPSFPLIGYPPM